MSRFAVDHYPRDGGVRSYGFWWGQTLRVGKTVVSARHWWARTSNSGLAPGTCIRIGFGDLSDADLVRVADDLDEDEVWVVLSEGSEYSDTPPSVAASSVFRSAEIIVRPRGICFVDVEPPMRHAFVRRIPRDAVPAFFAL